ncbi:MAG: hypothetical protein ACM3MI_01140, partial [Clostridiales bacterium]
ANDIDHALQYIKEMFQSTIFSKPDLALNFKLVSTLAFLFLFIIAEWLNREKQFALEFKESGSYKFSLYRKAVYIVLIFSIFTFSGEVQAFIYFQF